MDNSVRPFIYGIAVTVALCLGFVVSDYTNIDLLNKVKYEPILKEKIDTIYVPQFVRSEPIKGTVLKKQKSENDHKSDSLNSAANPDTSFSEFSVSFITDSVNVWATIIGKEIQSARLDSLKVDLPPVIRVDSLWFYYPAKNDDELTVVGCLIYVAKWFGVYQLIKWIGE